MALPQGLAAAFSSSMCFGLQIKERRSSIALMRLILRPRNHTQPKKAYAANVKIATTVITSKDFPTRCQLNENGDVCSMVVRLRNTVLSSALSPIEIISSRYRFWSTLASGPRVFLSSLNFSKDRSMLILCSLVIAFLTDGSHDALFRPVPKLAPPSETPPATAPSTPETPG